MNNDRKYVLDIVSNELLDVTGRLNGKLLRSSKYKYLRDIIYMISSCLDEQDDITHRLRWIQLDYTSPPVCKMCNNRVRFQKQTQLFNTYCCPKCRQSDNLIIEKAKRTNNERYGVDYGCVAPIAILKQKQTCILKYGVDKPFKSKSIQKKVRDNTIEKYGVVSTALVPEIKNQQLHTRQSRYGVDFLFQSKSFQERVKILTREKYDGKLPSQLHIHNEVYEKLNDKDWMYSEYISNNKSTTQIALDLNISSTTVISFIKQHNIPIKESILFSQLCINWLESIMECDKIFIQHAMNGGEFKIPGTRYKADGYCQQTNTIYEFHGDYWHGNPMKFKSDIFNESTMCTMGTLYQKTLNKENVIKDLGYNLVTIWESDYYDSLSL